MERDACHQSHLLHIFQSPQYRSPPPNPPRRAPIERERDTPPPEPSFTCLEVPGEGVPPPSSPSEAPMERGTPLTELSFTYILEP
jgi:hypothetical protein